MSKHWMILIGAKFNFLDWSLKVKINLQFFELITCSNEFLSRHQSLFSVIFFSLWHEIPRTNAHHERKVGLANDFMQTGCCIIVHNAENEKYFFLCRPDNCALDFCQLSLFHERGHPIRYSDQNFWPNSIAKKPDMVILKFLSDNSGDVTVDNQFKWPRIYLSLATANRANRIWHCFFLAFKLRGFLNDSYVTYAHGHFS